MIIKKTIVVLLTGALILGAYTLNILFTDGMHFSKGSYKYWVAISSDAIKLFPVLGSVGDPIYYYTSGDGPGPNVQEIRYLSNISESKLAESIYFFFRKQGFTKQNDFYIKDNVEVSVSFNKKAKNLIEVNAFLTSH